MRSGGVVQEWNLLTAALCHFWRADVLNLDDGVENPENGCEISKESELLQVQR